MMTYIASQQFYLRLPVPLILALLLSGCVTGLVGDNKTTMSPYVIKGTVTTDPLKSPPKEALSTHSASKAEQKLLSEELASLLSPAQAPSSSRPANLATDQVDPAFRPLLANPPDAVYRDALITEDMVWHGEVQVEGGVTVAPQTTLTVAPGTLVRFRKSGSGTKGVLLVQGRIIAKGTQTSPVLFTADFVEPQAGDWQGIVLLSSEKKNLFEHVRINGAEIALDASFSSVTVTNSFLTLCHTGVRLQNTLATLTGGGISVCDIGIAFYDSEADLRDTVINANRQGGVVVRTSLVLNGSEINDNVQEALVVDSSRIMIAGASFTSNGSGLRLAACDGTVTGSRFRENANYGLFLARSRVRVNNNEIAGNGSFGLFVEDGQGIAWDNRFAGNGKYDVYNAGSEDFRAIGNWWDCPADGVQSRIYDRQADPASGRVFYMPVLKVKPLPLRDLRRR